MDRNEWNFALQMIESSETHKMLRMDAADFWNLREPVIDQWFYNPDGTLTGAAFHYHYYSTKLHASICVDVDMYRRTVLVRSYDPNDSYTGRLFEGERLNLLDYLADVVWID